MNAIVIEQNPDDTRRAFEVNQHAAISRIRLSRAKLVSKVVTDASKPRISLTFSFKSKSISAPPGILRLEIGFRMAGTEEPEEDTPDKKADSALVVECAYEVDYLLNEDFQITPEHVRAFKDGNAIFNTWPYFREYLQNSLQRMGLPPLTAPFLRLQPKTKARRVEKQPLED